MYTFACNLQRASESYHLYSISFPGLWLEWPGQLMDPKEENRLAPNGYDYVLVSFIFLLQLSSLIFYFIILLCHSSSKIYYQEAKHIDRSKVIEIL